MMQNASRSCAISSRLTPTFGTKISGSSTRPLPASHDRRAAKLRLTFFVNLVPLLRIVCRLPLVIAGHRFSIVRQGHPRSIGDGSSTQVSLRHIELPTSGKVWFVVGGKRDR